MGRHASESGAAAPDKRSGPGVASQVQIDRPRPRRTRFIEIVDRDPHSVHSRLGLDCRQLAQAPVSGLRSGRESATHRGSVVHDGVAQASDDLCVELAHAALGDAKDFAKLAELEVVDVIEAEQLLMTRRELLNGLS